MPVDPRLYEELAKALAQPSKAYQAATEAINIPRKGLEGYLEGTDAADKISESRLSRQTLEQALGGNVPDSLTGYRGLTVKQFKPTAELLGGVGALDKALKEGQPKAEDYLTPDQARAAKVPEEVIASFKGGPVPRQVAFGVINSGIGQQRANAVSSMADSRQRGVQNAILGTALRYSQAGMAQNASRDSFGRLANINRAQQILDQIDAQGGQATIRQRTELASSVGRSINPTGVLTNEALNLYIPQTLKGKIGNFTEYLTNESSPVDFTGFTGELGGLLQREKEVNQGIISVAAQFGAPAINQLKQTNPSLARQVLDANNNPLVTNPGANQWIKKTYKKTAKNAQGVTIGTNDNWKTFEPVKQ
jgi:hypothetical protein